MQVGGRHATDTSTGEDPFAAATLVVPARKKNFGNAVAQNVLIFLLQVHSKYTMRASFSDFVTQTACFTRTSRAV